MGSIHRWQNRSHNVNFGWVSNFVLQKREILKQNGDVPHPPRVYEEKPLQEFEA